MVSLASRVSALILLLALVVVPTVMRSRQRIERRETTRLSIRLNWQSDSPPQRGAMLSDSYDATIARATLVSVELPNPPRVAARVHAYDEPIAGPVLDNAPDSFRGPPSRLS